MLTRIVNGKVVEYSESEEKNIRKYWALNDKYPEYSGHCAFDWASEPFHVMENCKDHHKIIVNQLVDEKIKDINSQIELAEESGEEFKKHALLSKRKFLKSQKQSDVSSMNTIDDLKQHLETIKTL
jgi:hypothetical protein